MTPKKRPTHATSPLTVDLPISIFNQIEAARKARGFETASETVRFALAQFDFSRFTSAKERRLQISVRVPRSQRVDLRRAARQKGVAIGELVRAAIENLKTNRKRG